MNAGEVKRIVLLILILAGLVSSSGYLFSSEAAGRWQGFERHRQLAGASPSAGIPWQFIGPTNISGRCTDIAVVTPRGPQYTIYVATASGGVWKTENEGTSWNPVLTVAPSTAIGALALAPGNQEIIWAGTGEANIFRSSQSGIGVFRSLDGGKTWAHRGLDESGTIARIVIHPTDPDIVYVAASGKEWTNNPERGVYKTSDGGATWNQVLYINSETGAIDLVMDPRNPETIYAATWQRIRRKWNDPRNQPHYRHSGILRSDDGGRSWKELNRGLPEARFRGRIGLDIARSNPDVLYALVDNYEQLREPTAEELADDYGLPSSGIIRGATVYRSADRGETWRQVSGLTPEMKKFMADLSVTFGWVFGQIRVDPGDENKVYAMGLWLNVSSDGGATFREIRGMHVDHHGLWIDPDNPRYLVNVNDGGIVISYDGGDNWRHFTHNLPVSQFYNLAFDTAGPDWRIYGSLQDHGSFRGKIDLRNRDRIPAVPFEQAPGGEASHHAIDPRDANLVYSAGFYGRLSRTDLSVPGRAGRKDIFPRVFPGEPRLRGQWLAPFLISPHNPDTLLLGTQYLFRSVNRGDTWERISPDLSRNDPAKTGDIPFQTIFSLAESPLKSGLLYAGTDDGRAHVSRDDGRTWQDISRGLAPGKWISRVIASTHDMGTVYLAQNGKREDDFKAYLWKSSDFGRNWKSIAAGVPLGPINVIREDALDPGILYLGTDLGVYLSRDRGENWEVLGGGLDTTYVHDLLVHPLDDIVVIATHGRGMWALDMARVRREAGQAKNN